MSNPADNRSRCPIPVWWVLILGVVLRLAFLGTKSFQIDECWTFFVATDDGSLWENTTFANSYDPHPFLFYALYRALAPLIVGSEALFRLPVALFSILSLFAYRAFLSQTRLSQGMRDWSLLLFAVLPANVFYAYDARSYSLAQLTGIGVMYFYLAYRQRGHALDRVGLALSVGFSCTFDVIGLTPVLAIGLDWLFSAIWPTAKAESGPTAGADSDSLWDPTSKSLPKTRPKPQPMRMLATMMLGVVLSLPYMWFRWQQKAATGESEQYFKPFHPITFIDNLTQLSPFGVGQLHIGALPGGWGSYSVIGFLTILVLLSGAWWAVSARDEPNARSEHRLFWCLVLPPFLGQLVFLLLSGGVPLHRRYLMVIVAGLVPIMVAGVSQLVNRWPGNAGRFYSFIPPFAKIIALCLLPLAISLTMSWRLGTRPDWRTLMYLIADEYRESDGVLHPYASPAPGFVASPFFVYLELNGKQSNRNDLVEPRVSLNHLRSHDDKEISLADAKDWAKESDLATTIEFLRSHAGGRVWTFSTPLTEHRGVDLSPYAALKQTWTAPGLHARLYEVSSGAAQE